MTITIAPPPAIGGVIAKNADPFMFIFDAPYGMSVQSIISDMIDRTVGVLQHGETEAQSVVAVTEENVPPAASAVFIAMPMIEGDQDLSDSLDAIKVACQLCGLKAERIDDQESSERITDRILQSIREARLVVVELTHARPNVYFEAGYAHALGKTPVYVARTGTEIAFDLKDYPVLFFNNSRDLRTKLERRLVAILALKRVD